tara:strand:- start:186 stop:353 length:168 start_codon:yes stop_codon:yes gene_type:complete
MRSDGLLLAAWASSALLCLRVPNGSQPVTESLHGLTFIIPPLGVLALFQHAEVAC